VSDVSKDDHYDLIGDPVVKLSMQGAREARNQIEELRTELNEALACAHTLRRQYEAVVRVLKVYTQCSHTGVIGCHCTRAATGALDLMGEDY